VAQDRATAAQSVRCRSISRFWIWSAGILYLFVLVFVVVIFFSLAHRFSGRPEKS
jgi:hypothetical protein